MVKLIKIIEIQAVLNVKTGLRIGAGDTEMRIGGVDAPIIKDPVTRLPYIPASSIKGKIRSMLELTSGKCNDGKPLSMKSAGNDEFSKNIVKLFGESADNKSTEVTLGRLSFWDSKLLNEQEIKNNTGGFLTEVKSENVINRITGIAENPRQIERIPAGAKFDFKITFKQFEDDNINELLETIKKGLKLLEMDSLGGSGSRGYGKVEFENLVIDNKSIALSEVNPFPES